MVENVFDANVEHLVIRVNGRFDYSCHKVFRDAFVLAPRAKSYQVDLSHVEYLDSSALGMLLLLRDYAGGEEAHVALTNSSKAVNDLLKMANFNRLFDMSE